MGEVLLTIEGQETSWVFPEGTTPDQVIAALEHIGGRPNDRK